MDLYVEKQCVEQMKEGNAKQFLLLFDAYFPDLYRYTARRLGQGEEAEKVVRLTFLDALGQIQNTPTDLSYQVWLYSLAKPRAWEVMGGAGFLEKKEKAEAAEEGEEVLMDSRNMFQKLSLEEREILRLKFFEEVADSDVMVVLGIKEGLIGPRIYRVLKRAYFLLFGESDSRQGVYFGELSGFLARAREAEEVVTPEAFKLSLRADISSRIERREFAVDVEPVEEKRPPAPPFASREAVGSNDPAKIFVEAARELREEAQEEHLKHQLKVERQERVFDFIDKWKVAFALIPAVVFVAVVAFFVIKFVDFERPIEPIERGYPTVCETEVSFEGIFADREKRQINREISDPICENFDVRELSVVRIAEEVLEVKVQTNDWILEYKFVKKVDEWRIKEYAKTSDSDKKPGEIPRNKRGA